MQERLARLEGRCDEIEKALAGVGGQGDSGVSTRLFGTVLSEEV